MTQRKFSVPGAAPILFLLLTACGGGDRQSPVEAGLDSQTLYFNVGSEVQNLDPHTVTGVPESRVLRSLLEGLTGKEATDLSPIPAAAESWTISSDGRRYRFRLRPDGRWSNGDPVTAADFAYAWRRLLSPNLAAEYAYMLYPISGAEDYHQGRLKDFSEVGVRVIDPLTLEVRLRNPTPYFLQLLDHYVSFPVHRPTIEKHGPIDRRNTAWTRPQHFVGNGPYHLISWEITAKLSSASARITGMPTATDCGRFIFCRWTTPLSKSACFAPANCISAPRYQPKKFRSIAATIPSCCERAHCWQPTILN